MADFRAGHAHPVTLEERRLNAPTPPLANPERHSFRQHISFIAAPDEMAGIGKADDFSS
jgi:hypothetical protein